MQPLCEFRNELGFAPVMRNVCFDVIYGLVPKNLGFASMQGTRQRGASTDAERGLLANICKPHKDSRTRLNALSFFLPYLTYVRLGHGGLAARMHIHTYLGGRRTVRTRRTSATET